MARRRKTGGAVAGREEPSQGHLSLRQVAFESWSGPYPSPTQLAQYDSTLPGAANRIIQMAEEQSAHRRGLEAQRVASDVAIAKRAQVFALVTILVCIGCGTFLIWSGKDASGLAAILAPLGAVAGVYVWGRHTQQAELEKRRRELDPRRGRADGR